MSNDNRVPPGSPEGGQFTRKMNAETSGVQLSDHSDNEGSFRYPPAMNYAEEVVEFWSHCKVDDEVMDSLMRHCLQARQNSVVNYVQGWEADNPRPTNPNDLQTWSRSRNMVAQQAQEIYKTPNRGDYRTLARLNQMMRVSADTLPPRQYEILSQYEFTLPITKQRGTAVDLLSSYGADTADLDNVDTSRDDTELYSALINKLEGIENRLSDISYAQTITKY